MKHDLRETDRMAKMRSGKRIVAGILAAVMVLSSVQFSGSVSYAEELPQSAQENTLEDGVAEWGDALQQEPGEEQDGKTKQEPEEKQDEETKQEPGDGQDGKPEKEPEEKQDGEPEKEPGEEQDGETEQESGEKQDEEETEQPGTDEPEAAERETGETDVELPKDGESVSENDLQISGNTLMSVEETPVWVQAEIEGVYQFGGAPSAKGEIALYSASAYTEEEMMDYLYQQMKKRSSQIDISEYRLAIGAVRTLISSTLNEHPDLYFVNNRYSYYSGDGYITSLVFTYSDAYDDAAFDREAGKALAAADGCANDLQKAIVLHDWLTVNCEYDQENLLANTLPEESFRAYGVFVNRIAVCQGYALAYKYLLNQVGIDCYMVTSDEIDHAWNLIKLDGQYYQVDVTWDDPVWDLVGRSVHTYMFRSDGNFDPETSQQKHTGGRVTYGSQTVDYRATDTRYDNAFWTDCRSPLVISGSDCFYISPNGGSGGKPALMKTGLSDVTQKGTPLQEIEKWKVWLSGNMAWSGAYSGLYRIGDRLYYNDKDNIYSVAMGGTDRKTVFTADTRYGYIYGSAYCKGAVRYSLHQDPNLKGKEEVLKADIVVDGIEQAPSPESGVALNLDNLYCDFTALDGTRITSAANNRPKLLIFYRNPCGNCQGTIKNISGAIDRFRGIDIYALETDGGTQADTAKMQETYGCAQITFAYDTSTKNKNSMWAYLHEAGINDATVALPVLCYIDRNNRFQYITRGLQTADAVRDNLTKYCGYQQIYQITYVLRGGTNDSANPSEYTEDDTCIILQEPVREGYQFEGWYSDVAYTARVTEIYGANKSDIILYAKWKPLAQTESPMIDLTPANGNVLMGISGTYYTETADVILKRLNEIRLEACEEGVRNPDTGEPLTMDDYVPIQWSSDLEAIARLRAAEATVNQDHTRPNGTGCFTVVTANGERSWAENLAWNYSGLMAGIEQWYSEKNDWVKQTAGKVTGHYTNIIDPKHHAVGLGAFRLSSGGWYAVAQEFSRKDGLDARKDSSKGVCMQNMEVQGTKVTNLTYTGAKTEFLQEGESCRDSINVKVQYGTKNFTGPYQAGGYWSTSNERVVAVDSTGEVIAVGKGMAVISLYAGTKSLSSQITVFGKEERPITVKVPNVTTYKVGQKLNLKGGTVTYPSGGKPKTAALAANMVSGFDSSKPGICRVKVTAGGYIANFETLIVEDPKIAVAAGRRLAEIALPQNANGIYSWQDDTKAVEKAGVYTFAAVFTPKDKTKFQTISNIQVEVTAQETFGSDTDVTLKTNHFTYNGAQQEPKPVVRSSDVVLKEGQDYELTYENNQNAGEATVTVSGRGCYLGSISKTFEISPAPLVIAAQDMTLLIGDPMPEAADYAYVVRGLLAEDTLIKEPTFSCGITNTNAAGRYEIIPGGADVGPNYTVSGYEHGILTVAAEAVSCTVTFDTQGRGTAPAAQIGLKVGGLTEKPADPVADGYRFDGWYREAACTKVWNFDTDTVQEDITLYAKWMRKGGDGVFALQEIPDLYYTGNACKPAVSVYDGDTLLKSGRDYQIKYYNNVNANKDGVLKTGNGAGVNFNAQLPYVEIIGKGNYTDRIKDGNKDTVKVNFNIHRATIGDGTETPAKGVTLKVTDQLVTAKKVQKPFSSVKYVKAMKRDTDFEVRLTVENARDGSGRSLAQGLELAMAELPKEYAGEFLLTVEGKGNYTGSIQKKIYVADKAHLMKNAAITIGKDIKNIEFTGEEVRLKAAEMNAADVFTVKYGKMFLKPGRDYTVSYRNNDKVGKAELLITGNGEYVGTKTATFQIKGKAFSARTVRVEGLTALEYTGKALTQNNVSLTWYMKNKPDEPLTYGKHYTVSYAKNLNKGTATVTFRGVEKNGYSGSFKKTFKITAVDIADPLKVARADSMNNMSFLYCKAGVKPVEEIRLTNKEGIVLQNGKDYTLKYKNNKAVADAQAEKPPTVTVQGKGNYSGKFDVTFAVTKRGLKQAVDDGGIQTQTTVTVYQPKKEETFAYKPAVKLMEGRTALRANKDYEVAYHNNTQKECREYLEAYESYRQNVINGNADPDAEKRLQAIMPKAVITAKADSSYLADGEIVVPLQIYRTKLAARDLEITVAEMIYVGNPVTDDQQPAITVKVIGNDGAVLVPGQDYTITYGANNKSGRNAGSVKITGIAPRYGGSVTKRFDIVKKPITY